MSTPQSVDQLPPTLQLSSADFEYFVGLGFYYLGPSGYAGHFQGADPPATGVQLRILPKSGEIWELTVTSTDVLYRVVVRSKDIRRGFTVALLHLCQRIAERDPWWDHVIDADV